MKLVLCQSCSRHLKSEDRACPFCGARTSHTRGLVAAALVGVALAGAACKDDNLAAPAYGLPAMTDGGANDAGVHSDAGI